MIISVHLPKTAGSSFKASLHQNFDHKLLLDYEDLPLNTPVFERNKNVFTSGLINAERDFGETECIHGHFMPAKYLLLNSIKPLKFVTWMRHPVDRVISHYYFWQRRYNPDAPPLHKRIVEEKWSLEKFCLSDEMKNIYQQFLWGFPIWNFDFIGITEYYEADFKYFSDCFFNKKVDLFNENINPNSKGGYAISKSFRKQIESFHAEDMELYERANRLRLQRDQRLSTRINRIVKKKLGFS